MSERQIGFIFRLAEFIRLHILDIGPDNQQFLREAETLKAQLWNLISTKETCDSLQLATDIINYAIMQFSFIDCKIPLPNDDGYRKCQGYYFQKIVAAALVYRNVIHKHLRLHAPTRVDTKLFEEMMADMILNALMKVHPDHRHVVACACIVSAAHFFFQRGVEEYVGFSRNFFAKFMEADFFKRFSTEQLDAHSLFDGLDISSMRNAILAPNGAGKLHTHYEED